MPSRFGLDLRASLIDNGEWQTPSQGFKPGKLFNSVPKGAPSSCRPLDAFQYGAHCVRVVIKRAVRGGATADGQRGVGRGRRADEVPNLHLA